MKLQFHSFLLICVSFISLSSGYVSAAQPPENKQKDTPSKFNQALEEMEKEELWSSTNTAPPVPLPKDTVSSSSLVYTSTIEMKNNLGKVLYESYILDLRHNREIFEWQLYSSRVIFWVVLILVSIGIIFSAIQFYKSMLISRSIKESDRLELQTELEVSAKGLKISSPVLGVIILVISLAFFYLFIIHVYPIQTIGSATQASESNQIIEKKRGEN